MGFSYLQSAKSKLYYYKKKEMIRKTCKDDERKQNVICVEWRVERQHAKLPSAPAEQREPSERKGMTDK
jgi:hypothetical protein